MKPIFALKLLDSEDLCYPEFKGVVDTSGDVSSGSHSVGKTVSERDHQLSSPEISNSPLHLRSNSKIVPLNHPFF